VTEPANIRIRWMRISCSKSIGFGCGFVARPKLSPASILATAIQLSYYKKLSYCWETVRRESMTKIAEMDAEMTT